MIKSREIRWVVVGLAMILGLPLGYYFFIIDWEGRPFCHKQIDGALQQWMLEEAKTNAFPNVRGKSRDSLAVAGNYIAGPLDWANNYNYVPGLHNDDPSDLVLMYINRPTRWNWHGQHPTIFKKKAWIIVPLQAREWGKDGLEFGELSERVSLDEFRSRLRRTLDFLRTNERPNWQVVVDEHTKFLESIEPLKR